MKKNHLVTVFVIGLCLLQLLEAVKWTVHPVTARFKDEYERYRVIHGVNAAYRKFPFYPTRQEFDFKDSLVAKDFQNLKSWGFNSIRLSVMWEGFEPERDRYNYTYLQKIRQIVREAEQYGITILLDAHQDHYSRKFCGRGFPDWLVKVDNFPFPLKVKLEYDSQGYPTKESCQQIQSFRYYAAQDVMTFSSEFFANQNGQMDQFIQMWTKIAAYFQPETNVIGYDVLNDPLGVSIYQNPFMFIGPGNNNGVLLPFYKKLSSQIRHIDTKKLLFFEPSAADYFGEFYSAPGEQKFHNLDVISFHSFCPLVDKEGSLKCKIMDQYNIYIRLQNMKHLGVGGVMTQFGGMNQDPSKIEELKFHLKAVEPEYISWYYWQFKQNGDQFTSAPHERSFYQANGKLQSKKVKELAHPYAYAICGQPLEQVYDDQHYSFKWIPAVCQGRNTEIYVNEDMYFQNGFKVQFSPDCSQCRLHSLDNRNYYSIELTRKMKGTQVTITLAGQV